jgi:hypothetical protein
MLYFKNILSRFALYPFLASVYPVLFLYLENIFRVKPFVILPIIGFDAAICTFVYLVSWLFIRRLLKAAAVSAFIVTMFNLYGHIFTFVDNLRLGSFILGRHRYFLPFWIVLALFGVFLILRIKSNFRSITLSLNLILSIFSLVVLAQIGYWSTIFTLDSIRTQSLKANRPVVKNSTAVRDVYYIVVDGYNRQDVLLQSFGVDNRDFIRQLENLGFVIPDCTHSNYTDTVFSMAATFNMDYLTAFGYSFDRLANQVNERVLAPMIHDSLVFQAFRNMGYTTITFHTPYSFLDMPDSDIYFDFQASAESENKIELLNFRYLYLRTTLLRVLIEEDEFNPQAFQSIPPVLLQWIIPDASKLSSRNYLQYEQNLYDLDTLERIPQIPGKKFVYAHLLMTHVPFVFMPDGSIRPSFFDSKETYADQVRFASKRIPEIVKTIIDQSAIPPVIILQADHGWVTEIDGKASILNAYYLPDGGNQKVYPNITPVNTFRLIFNQYFGGSYPLLPDESFYIDPALPGDFVTIPPGCVNSR